jgi:hypothetical protein
MRARRKLGSSRMVIMASRAEHEAGQSLARFVLSSCDMRTRLTAMMVLLMSSASIGRAFEARSELTMGREFVFLTSELEVELIDGQLALGGGITMVSDYTIERYGAQALIAYRGEHASAGVAAAFGPRQEGRGWASLDPQGELRFTIGRWSLHAEGGVLLRRVDAEAKRARIAVDQLQLHAAFEMGRDERWRVGAFALYSFYDPDPAVPALRDLDLGLAVTLGGRPERWAAGGHVAVRTVGRLWVELGAAGVVYADGRGAAVVPRAVVRVVAWRGVSVSGSLDLVVGIDQAARQGMREIGGLELEYER